MLDDAGLQVECNHLTIAQLPDFLTWIPLATGLLHPLSEVDFRKANTQGDYLVSWDLRYWRFPGPLGDDELYRLAALFLLRIMPIAHTDETIAVYGASHCLVPFRPGFRCRAVRMETTLPIHQ